MADIEKRTGMTDAEREFLPNTVAFIGFG